MHKKNKPKNSDFVEKVKQGLAMSHHQLLVDKAREKKELVLATKDGKIYTIKAQELLDRLNHKKEK